jgi:hypothetical protein
MPWPDNFDSIPANDDTKALADGHVSAHALLKNTAEKIQQSFGTGPITSVAGLNSRVGALESGGGTQGPQGAPGAQGSPGAASTVPGPQGVGVATGGTTGQVLTKASNANYDTNWTTVYANGGGSGSFQVKSIEDWRLSTDPDYTAAFTKAFTDLNAGTEVTAIALEGKRYDISANLPIVTAPLRMFTTGNVTAHLKFSPGLQGLDLRGGWGLPNYLSNFLLDGSQSGGAGGTQYHWWPTQANDIPQNDGLTLAGRIQSTYSLYEGVRVNYFNGNGITIWDPFSFFCKLDRCEVVACGGHGLFNYGGMDGSVWKAELCNFMSCANYGIINAAAGWTYDRCHTSYNAALVGMFQGNWSDPYNAGQNTLVFPNEFSYTSHNTPSWMVGDPGMVLNGPGIQPGTYITNWNAGTHTATLSKPTTGSGTGDRIAVNWAVPNAQFTHGSRIVQCPPEFPVGNGLIGRQVGSLSGVPIVGWTMYGYSKTPTIRGIDTVNNRLILDVVAYGYGSASLDPGMIISNAGAFHQRSVGCRVLDMYSEPDRVDWWTMPGILDYVNWVTDDSLQSVGVVDQTGWTNTFYRILEGPYTGKGGWEPDSVYAKSQQDIHVAMPNDHTMQYGFLSAWYAAALEMRVGGALFEAPMSWEVPDNGGTLRGVSEGAVLTAGAHPPPPTTGGGYEAGTIYFRTDTPTVAGQRIYMFDGTTWHGIA